VATSYWPTVIYKAQIILHWIMSCFHQGIGAEINKVLLTAIASLHSAALSERGSANDPVAIRFTEIFIKNIFIILYMENCLRRLKKVLNLPVNKSKNNDELPDDKRSKLFMKNQVNFW